MNNMDVEHLRDPGDGPDDAVLGLDNLGIEELFKGRRRIGQPGPRFAGRGSFRGPRRAAPPTGDVKMRLGMASQMFIREEYEEAKKLAFEIITINAETLEAWTLLASVWKEQGRIDHAITCLMFAAHMRPKHLEMWFSVARYALEETGDERAEYLYHAQFAYSRAVHHDPTSIEARFGKARTLYEQNKLSSCLKEFLKLSKLKPHDMEILDEIAMICIDLENAEPAIECYKETIAHIRKSPGTDTPSFGWADAVTYLELYTSSGQYDLAIKELKSLARWLLGREEETYWDDVTANDCEWDASNTRRLAIDGFVAGKYPDSSYGPGLPIQLRVKLGLNRLHLYSSEFKVKTYLFFSSGTHVHFLLLLIYWQRHFEFLDPENRTGEERVKNNPSLCRNVADALLDSDLHDTALRFYKPLLEIPEENDASLHVQVGKCFLHQKLEDEAVKSFKKAILLDDSDTEARGLLVKIYDERKEDKPAFDLINQILERKRLQLNESELKPDTEVATAPRKRPSRRKKKTEIEEFSEDHPFLPNKVLNKPPGITELATKQQLEAQYHVFESELEGMRNGNAEATETWMNAAQKLTDDFRSVSSLYPSDNNQPSGLLPSEDVVAQSPLDAELSIIADHLSECQFPT